MLDVLIGVDEVGAKIGEVSTRGVYRAVWLTRTALPPNDAWAVRTTASRPISKAIWAPWTASASHSWMNRTTTWAPSATRKVQFSPSWADPR